MSHVNSSQVQSTNDASTTSKFSAVSKNYFNDCFIEHFVEKAKPRASLINLGYYTRAVILFKLIENYLNFFKRDNTSKLQIISCGSGFDTSYWRLTEVGLLNKEFIFVEIDFPNIIKRKIGLINESQLLKSYTAECQKKFKIGGINQLNLNYFLLEADLCDIGAIEVLFNSINIDYKAPTLFISECVITYMKEESSRLFINWMAQKFSSSAFINYEQVHPNDGFGQVMLKHFEKLQSNLYSVENYIDCSSHCSRYKDNGFEKSVAVSEWDALMSLTTEAERQTALNCELFDEFEEFHNKCVHYVIGVATNGISSKWINCLTFDTSTPKGGRNSVQVRHISDSFELYRHSSFVRKKKTYLVGGCNKQKRSCKIFRINFENNYKAEEVELSGTSGFQMDIVYGSTACFELNGMEFCCLYGGRTSPDSVSNKGAVILFEITDKKLSSNVVITNGNPNPRYRTAMVSLNTGDNKVQCWIFGGRTKDQGKKSLSDLCCLKLYMDDTQAVKHTWKIYEESYEQWPCGRMSHSMVSCSKRFCFFMSCGLNAESSTVLNDVWKWCPAKEMWHKLDLLGQLLPRYGHTSHIINDVLYLVGGVNTLAGWQPGLAKICLNTLTVTEYVLEATSIHPVLFFNHTSVVYEDDEGIRHILILGGGGNCFSFGTHLNRGIHSVPADRL